MNIGLMIPNLRKGGAEKFVDRLAEELGKEHQVFVITYLDDGQPTEEKNYAHISLGETSKNKLVNQLTRIRKVKQIKKEKNLHCVISFLENPNLINILSQVNGTKTILSVRNYKSKQLQGIKGFSYKWLIQNLYNRADVITTNAARIREDLIENFHLKPEKIKVIHNFYQHAHITALAAEAIEDELDTIFQKGAILSFGRIEKVKGFMELVDAYEHSQLKNEDISLVIIGDGSQKEHLQAYIQQKNLEANVKLLGYQTNPYKYLKRSLLFVMNSYHEGFPNVLVESMICGIPVVATNCLSGPSEILHDGTYRIEEDTVTYCQYGLLIPTPDHKQATKILSEAMREVALSPQKRARYTQLSIKGAERYNTTTIIPEWIEVLS